MEATMQDVDDRLKYLTYLAMKKMDEFLQSTEQNDRKSKLFKVDKNSEKRPVTQTDINDWCVELKKKLEGNAPNGYIVRIPGYFNGMRLSVDANVKASKFFHDTLYIQVNPGKRGDVYIVECNEDGEWTVHQDNSRKGKGH